MNRSLIIYQYLISLDSHARLGFISTKIRECDFLEDSVTLFHEVSLLMYDNGIFYAYRLANYSYCCESGPDDL